MRDLSMNRCDGAGALRTLQAGLSRLTYTPFIGLPGFGGICSIPLPLFRPKPAPGPQAQLGPPVMVAIARALRGEGPLSDFIAVGQLIITCFVVLQVVMCLVLPLMTTWVIPASSGPVGIAIPTAVFGLRVMFGPSRMTNPLLTRNALVSCLVIEAQFTDLTLVPPVQLAGTVLIRFRVLVLATAQLVASGVVVKGRSSV